MSVTYWASINNLPDKSRSSAGRTVHEGHGNRNGTDEVIRTDNGSNQSHLLCPVLLLLFITEIILLLTLLYFTLLYSTGFHSVFAPCQKAFQKFYFSKKERYFFICFLQVFRCFSIVFSTLPVRIFLFENVLFPYRKTAFQMNFPNGFYSDLYRKTILGYTTPSAQVNWAKSIKLRKNSELRRKKSGTK